MKRSYYAPAAVLLFVLFLATSYFTIQCAKPAPKGPVMPQEMVITLHKQTDPMKLKLINSVSDVKSGQCLVQFDQCYFDKLSTPKWERSKCDMIAFSHSYQVVDVDQDVKKVLTVPWFGEGNDGFVENSNDRQTLDLAGPFNSNPDTQWNNYYQGNCDELKMYSQQKVEDHRASRPLVQFKPSPEQELVPKFKKSQCVALKANCPEGSAKEAWETSCHPYENVYKIVQVGKSNYLAQNWYGYQNPTLTLLGTKQTVAVKDIDESYTEVNCLKMKHTYPKGNYNPIYLKSHPVLRAKQEPKQDPKHEIKQESKPAVSSN